MSDGVVAGSQSRRSPASRRWCGRVGRAVEVSLCFTAGGKPSAEVAAITLRVAQTDSGSPASNARMNQRSRALSGTDSVPPSALVQPCRSTTAQNRNALLCTAVTTSSHVRAGAALSIARPHRQRQSHQVHTTSFKQIHHREDVVGERGDSVRTVGYHRGSVPTQIPRDDEQRNQLRSISRGRTLMIRSAPTVGPLSPAAR